MSASTSPPEQPSWQRTATGGGEVAAAVLAAIFLDVEAEPHLVLTRRRADLRRHAGEISLPGGRQDAEDADLAITALREAEEEIGLPPDQVTLLGTLPTVSTFATGYVIHPFVGTIPRGLVWSLSPVEVAAVLELPLSGLRGARTRTRIERRGLSFETDAYVLGEHIVWGATARIVEHLLASVRGVSAGGALELAGVGPLEVAVSPAGSTSKAP